VYLYVRSGQHNERRSLLCAFEPAMVERPSSDRTTKCKIPGYSICRLSVGNLPKPSQLSNLSTFEHGSASPPSSLWLLSTRDAAHLVAPWCMAEPGACQGVKAMSSFHCGPYVSALGPMSFSYWQQQPFHQQWSPQGRRYLSKL
jgi:hypothetical protein